MEPLRRRGAAPPGDEVLRRHGGQQQRELQHSGARELRHDCAAVTYERKRALSSGSQAVQDS